MSGDQAGGRAGGYVWLTGGYTKKNKQKHVRFGVNRTTCKLALACFYLRHLFGK